METTKYNGMPVLAFDTETELMSYENPVPDLLCLTYADTGSLKGNIKTPWEYDIEQQFKELFTSGQHMVGHNIAFDLSILAFRYPDLVPYIFDALDREVIHDTMMRERLLMLTRHGNFEVIEVNGAIQRPSYSLAALETKYLNIDRSNLKDDADAPRMNYAMYKDIPLERWDESFISYAVDDAVNTGLVFEAQEREREACVEEIGVDPYIVETFRVRVSFALRLLECVGQKMDPVKLQEVAETFRKEYGLPRLREPLLKSGLLLDAVPAQPYAKKTREHLPTCRGHKDHPEYKKQVKDCDCPLKMKKAVPEKNPTKALHQYIWNLAHTNPNVEAWPSDSCASYLRKANSYDDVIVDGAFMKSIIASTVNEEGIAILPKDVKLTANEEWASTFVGFDNLLGVWAERRSLRKIITDYLPKMFYTDEHGNEIPAKIVRSSFYPLALTGRSTSSASKLYPSRNGQNVDPRVRPCTVARDGYLLVSSDYSGMELGTLAQKCFSLFGYSVLADKINKGIDTHAFLAAQIASALDKDFGGMLDSLGIDKVNANEVYNAFAQTKGLKDECSASEFCTNFKNKYKQEKNKDLDRPVLWSDFFKYYRTLAKPTGLGFPGGLSAKTMITYAKGTFKVELTEETATQLRDIWLETYPEMVSYFRWIKESCKDNHHAPIEEEEDDGSIRKRVFFAYDTPRGMHRAKCGYCNAANGAGLQAPSAEGALEGLYRTQKLFWCNGYKGELKGVQQFIDMYDPTGLLEGSFAENFIHDEILWETPSKGYVDGKKVAIVEKIMIDSMEEITPNVRAGAESAAMARWYKEADSVIDDKGNLVAWEPEIQKKGI